MKHKQYFDWMQYLHIANALYSKAVWPSEVTPEGRYRAAMSRAYYALFHHVRLYAIKTLDYQLPTRRDKISAHQHLIDHLKDHNIDFAQNLEEARNLRTKCDYENNLPIDINTLSKSLRLSLKKIEKDIESLKVSSSTVVTH